MHRSIELQILKHLNCFESVPPYSIIAHTLGTAVIYKAMRAMITGTPKLDYNRRPAHLFALSNTVNVLWDAKNEGDLYDPQLGPSRRDNIGMCGIFGNFHHELDPFCNVDPFDRPGARPPDHWFHDPAEREATYINVEIPKADIQKINIHSFEHYLSHPSVHVPILRNLCSYNRCISNAEYQSELAKWQQSRLVGQSLGNAQTTLSSIVNSGGGGWANLLQMLADMRALVQGPQKPDGES